MTVKILIIDDEILQLELIGKIIRRFHPEYEVTTVNQPPEALELLKSGHFNALMTDVKMPDMSGIELIEEARKLNLQPLEIIILSGFDDFQYARSAITFDVLEYLLKPVNAGGLQAALKKLEKKLKEDYAQIRLQDDYLHMAGKRRATALFKKAMGLPLSLAESRTVEGFGRLRLILLEDSTNYDVVLSQLPPETCMEELDSGRYLFFVPVSFASLGSLPDQPVSGRMVVGLPAMPDESSSRLRELNDLLETACEMQLSYLVQSEPDKALLDRFVQAIRRQDAVGVMNLEPLFLAALRAGRITMSLLRETVRREVMEQITVNKLPHVYPCRQEDALQLVREQIAQCCLPQQLCVAVAEMLTSRQEEEGFKSNVLIYIDAHYGSGCLLDEISQAFHYSTAHFSRLFSAEFGTTYTRFMSDYRLERAKNLLMQTEMSVREIAQRVGIGDAGYFIRQFSKKFQVSPEKYRRRGG